MSKIRQMRFQKQKQYQKIVALVMSFIMPVAALSASYFIINAENLETTESKADNSTKNTDKFKMVMEFSANTPGNRSDSSVIAMYDKWVAVLYADHNDKCSEGNSKDDPKIKIQSYNTNALEGEPQVVQNENEIGCTWSTNTPTPYYLADRDQTLIASGSRINGNIDYLNLGGYKAGIWGGCKWGWEECTWQGANIVGVYSGESESAFGESITNPKIVYTTKNQIKYTKYYGDGNVDWENSDDVGGYAQSRVVTDDEDVDFGIGTIVGDEVWVYRNEGDGRYKTVRVYDGLDKGKLTNIEDIDGIGKQSSSYSLDAAGNIEYDSTITGMIYDESLNKVYMTGWKARGNQTEAANTSGYVYAVNPNTKVIEDTLNLDSISYVAQPRHPIIYNNSLYFVSGFVTDTSKGLYKCPITNGVISSCSLTTLPAIDGKGEKNLISGLTRVKDKLYISVNVGDEGIIQLYEYNIVDNGSGSDDQQDEEPNGANNTTEDTTADRKSGENEVQQCIDLTVMPEEPIVGSKNMKRITCRLDESGKINLSREGCSGFAEGEDIPTEEKPWVDIDLTSDHVAFDSKVVAETIPSTSGEAIYGKVLQSYITPEVGDSEGLNQYRAYRLCEFDTETGTMKECGDTIWSDISGIGNSCAENERYESMSSYEFTISGEPPASSTANTTNEYSLMSYISTDHQTLVNQICRLHKDPNTLQNLDDVDGIYNYTDCFKHSMDISSLMGGENEKYTGYSAYIIEENPSGSDDPSVYGNSKLAQFFTDDKNNVYERVCEIEYRKNPDNDYLDIQVVNNDPANCTDFENITEKLENLNIDRGQSNENIFWDSDSQEKRIFSTMSPYTLQNGEKVVRIYVF